MITKIKRYILLSSSTLLLLLSASSPVVVHAAIGGGGTGCKSNIGNKISGGATATTGDSAVVVDCEDNTSVNDSIGGLATKIVNIFSFVVGAVAVIMIIYGGFRYITSGGDSNSVGSAKNTLIYAIIGLVIVVLAQIIVRFVLSTTNEATVA